MNQDNYLVADQLHREIKPLARSVVSQQYEQHPKLWERYGSSGYEKCVQDTESHLAYLFEALTSSSIPLFTDYIRWASVLFNALKVPPQDLAANLEATRTVLSERMIPSDVPLVVEYLNAGIALLSGDPFILKSFIDPSAPLGALARNYLDALLHANISEATESVFEAVRSGTPVSEIYQNVLMPSQRELGRLWQTNQISVAHEHYCTAATQRIMAQLYPTISGTPRIGRRMVGACVSGELHDMGMRMVTDTFEMQGWDTFYIGANTPLRSLLAILTERKPDVLALSATITYHLGKIREIIAAVRANDDFERIRIIVGGYPFNVSPRLWRDIGADGYAPDSNQAVQLAQELVQ
ncbi:MAG: cobalamin-dependent protein [Chloroflexota bacterium]